MKIALGQESGRHGQLGTYSEWDEEKKLEFLTRELKGKRPLIPLSMKASDILAVELLQKDARLAVSGEIGKPCPGGTLHVVPLFETIKDLRGAGSMMRKLLSIDWYREHIIKNYNGHQEVMV